MSLLLARSSPIAQRSLVRVFSGTSGFQLQPHAWGALARPDKRPVVVAILDGVGIGNASETNAVHLAHTPTLDALFARKDRFVAVKAHGSAVGLPTDDDMGNSEVGHNAIGCGRIVNQGASLVDKSLADDSIFGGSGWQHMQPSLEHHTLHLIGLLSDGGVHSRYNQIIAVVRGAVARGARRVRLHVLLDGRDVPDGSSLQFVEQLTKDLQALSVDGVDARIASGGGRMHVTMDRYEADWSIVERGWNAHVLGKAERQFTCAREAVSTMRGEGHTDQYLPSFVVTDEAGIPVGTIQDDDAVLFCNFRGDRSIAISRAFDEPDFDAFDRIRFPKTRYAGLMSYDGDLGIPKNYLVDPPLINKTSGEYLANNDVRTFAISETQKYGHVTYFWNGNRSDLFNAELETYQEIESDRVEFNQAPNMKAQQIADMAVKAISSCKYDMVRLNLANGDMVGHTGDLQASITAMEAVDRELKRVLDAVDAVGGRYLVTADHGNCDEMVQRNKKGEVLVGEDGKALPLTSHTLAPVPVCIGGTGLPAGAVLRQDVPNPGLCNITATFINLLGFEAPSDYETSLLTQRK